MMIMLLLISTILTHLSQCGNSRSAETLAVRTFLFCKICYSKQSINAMKPASYIKVVDVSSLENFFRLEANSRT